MRRIVLVLLCLALLTPAAAGAFNDPGDGGGGKCYWTWDGRFVCLP